MTGTENKPAKSRGRYDPNGPNGKFGNLPGPGPGRPKGSGLKAANKVREVLQEMADRLAPELEGWIREIGEKQGAAAALSAFTQLLEFSVPKLARTENVNFDMNAETAATKEQRDAAVKAVLAADE